MNLEQNPTNSNNQAELEVKKKKLKDLETKEKELTKSLPLTIQITNLQSEIKELENKLSRTKAEERLLISKKKELEELLKKQSNPNNTETKPSDKTVLAIGCGVVGVVGVVLVVSIFILAKIRKKKKIIKKYGT